MLISVDDAVSVFITEDEELSADLPKCGREALGPDETRRAGRAGLRLGDASALSKLNRWRLLKLIKIK